MAMRIMQSSSVFALLMQFGKMAAAVFPNDADSSTVFREVCGILSSKCLQDVVQCVQEARYYPISSDEKDGRLICLVTLINKGRLKETRPLAYGELSGHDAEDLAKFITAFQAAGLRWEGLVSFCVDEASVDGARRALSAGGDNVLRRLEQWAGQKLVAVILFGPRLQLYCSNALSGGDQYLLNLEAKVKALHRHLKASPGATVDMFFWADLCDERTAGTSTSRWLSLLLPLRKLLQSYVSVLAHLAYVFKPRKKNRESAKIHLWSCELGGTDYCSSSGGCLGFGVPCQNPIGKWYLN